jgi:hypothetical protein
MDSGNAVRRTKAGPNVYSVLAVIAFVVLAAGIGWLWTNNLDLLQDTDYADEAGSNAFYIIPTE